MSREDLLDLLAKALGDHAQAEIVLQKYDRRWVGETCPRCRLSDRADSRKFPPPELIREVDH